jgi:hypothetical protein
MMANYTDIDKHGNKIASECECGKLVDIRPTE